MTEIRKLAARVFYLAGRLLSRLRRQTSSSGAGYLAYELGAYDTAIRLDPNFDGVRPQIHMYRGQLLLKLVQFERAVDALQRASALRPDDPHPFHLLGEALDGLGRASEAAGAYQRAITLDESMHWSHFGLGRTLIGQQNYEAALVAFRQAIALNPANEWSHFLLLESLYELGRFNELVRMAQQVIELFPDRHIPYVLLGRGQAHLGRDQEALSSIRMASDMLTRGSQPGPDGQYAAEKRGGPDFIVIGQQKCGTTFFYQYLTQHPWILPAIWKEIRFWVRYRNQGMAWYEAHFPPMDVRQGFLTGEASPNLLDALDVPGQLAAYYPNVKLILLLRSPPDMIFSLYQMFSRRGQEKRSWGDIVNQELEDRLFALPAQHEDQMIQGRARYLSKGLYLTGLRRWAAYFPTDNFLILQSERLFEDPRKSFDDVFHFLDLPSYDCGSFRARNRGDYAPMERTLRDRLSAFYRPYNLQLEDYVGKKFNWD